MHPTFSPNQHRIIVLPFAGRGISRNLVQRCENRIPLQSSVRRSDRKCRPLNGVRATGERCSSSRIGTALGTCFVGSINFASIDGSRRNRRNPWERCTFDITTFGGCFSPNFPSCTFLAKRVPFFLLFYSISNWRVFSMRLISMPFCP